MRRNRLAALLTAAAFSCLLTSCGTSADTAAQHSVALVVKSTNTEFWLSVFAGAEAAAAEYNLILTTSGPGTEEDYEAQNRMIESAVEAGAEALVFSAIDYEKNAAAIDSAAQAGVQIVSIDSGVASDAVSTYIGTDNYAAGRMAAQAALESVEGPLSVGIVNYDEGTANGQEREQGVRDALEESGRARIGASVTTLVEAGRAQSDAAALLSQNPDINVLVAFNEPTSVGAARAVEEADEVRRSALQYTDDMLNNLQTILNRSMDEAQGRFSAFMQSMQSNYDVISSNREELAGSLVSPDQEFTEEEQP